MNWEKLSLNLNFTAKNNMKNLYRADHISTLT